MDRTADMTQQNIACPKVQLDAPGTAGPSLFLSGIWAAGDGGKAQCQHGGICKWTLGDQSRDGAERGNKDMHTPERLHSANPQP